MELKLPLLVYDADCPLCVRFKQGLERWDVDKRVCYVPLTHVEVFVTYPQLDPEKCRAVVHYIREDGTVLVGGEVVTELLKHYPGVSKLAWLLDSEVGRKTADFFYQKVEAVRQKMISDEAACGTCKKS
jgi:predicted DCC family thiol-disulfide oxidoreductase YuxK